jgi:hypothetical protein
MQNLPQKTRSSKLGFPKEINQIPGFFSNNLMNTGATSTHVCK